MDTFLLRMFQRQVALQCYGVISAAEQLNAALAPERREPREIWTAIQNCLTAAANVAKACWGEKSRHADARARLRDSLGVTDASPLKEVDMRNNFEHFDSRLDLWWANSERHNNVDLSVMPPSAIGGVDDIDMFRLFDPTTTDVVFWGERFNIQAIVTEAARIKSIAEVEGAKPHWE